jgi:hypothetical protein
MLTEVHGGDGAPADAAEFERAGGRRRRAVRVRDGVPGQAAHVRRVGGAAPPPARR